nr:hypothetical protein [Spongiactinospora gelatinilytica]
MAAAANAATILRCADRSGVRRSPYSRTRTRTRALDASCLTAPVLRPTMSAISSNGTSKTSCSTNDVRSAGVSRSSTASNARLIESSIVARSSGPSSSTTGSGNHCPMYDSRRERAEVSWS